VHNPGTLVDATLASELRKDAAIHQYDYTG